MFPGYHSNLRNKQTNKQTFVSCLEIHVFKTDSLQSKRCKTKAEGIVLSYQKRTLNEQIRTQNNHMHEADMMRCKARAEGIILFIKKRLLNE